VLIFDSAARRTLLGAQNAAAEIACIRETVGASVPVAGCYTYAEEAPFAVASNPDAPEASQVLTQTGSVLVVAVGS
jgi:hypothetical protein